MIEKMIEKIKSWLEGRFIVYAGQTEVQTVPRRKWRIGGNFLPRLHGVNFSVDEKGHQVSPVYIPLIKYENFGEVVAFDVHFWTLHPWTLIIMKFPPFIHLMRQGVVCWVEGEEESTTPP